MRKNELPFKKDDIVIVSNEDRVYFNYSQFIKVHFRYAIRWVYKEFPKQSHKFKIRGIYNHVLKNKYDKNQFVVVIQDIITKQIYLVGETGLTKDTKS